MENIIKLQYRYFGHRSIIFGTRLNFASNLAENKLMNKSLFKQAACKQTSVKQALFVYDVTVRIGIITANKLLQVCSQVVNKLCSHCLFLVCCNKFGTSC